MDRNRVFALGLIGIGLVSMLAGCRDAAPGGDPPSATSAMDCGAPIEWPESPGALSASLTAKERALVEGAWSDWPNFACSALLIKRGCGTGCATGLIHDARTGRTISLPFAIHREFGQSEPLLAFTVDSRVLIATGWRNEVEQGVFRYRWNGDRLLALDE